MSTGFSLAILIIGIIEEMIAVTILIANITITCLNTKIAKSTTRFIYPVK
jgi:hypothetical protein